jgi:adenine deaminase
VSGESIKITGQIVDVTQGRIYPGTVHVADGRIAGLVPGDVSASAGYILPGFVDAHIHVESSMLTPGEFARAALVHGVVGSVCDPHEIANVLGLEGVRAMLANGRRAPFHFAFAAPSCVPATPLETSGARLGPDAVSELFDTDNLAYLSEVMNVPGVLNGDPEVLAKLAAARTRGLPVDGHAPGLRGDDLRRYLAAGPSTDHESLTLEEAREKAALGMNILIRRGSAADALDVFLPLLTERPEVCMFCSDDRHPHDLLRGHINDMVRQSVHKGADLMNTLRAASLNPARHYGLGLGLLRDGDPADFIVVDDLRDFAVRQTWVGGRLVAERGRCLLPSWSMPAINRFDAQPRSAADFAVRADPGRLNVIRALDGSLVTEHLKLAPCLKEGLAVQDPNRDLLKLVVVNRYEPTAPAAKAFISGFGLKQGALASSVAHDSHHLVAVGASDETLATAVNLVIRHRGGLALCSDQEEFVLPLPIAGLMSDLPCAEVAARYTALEHHARALGCPLRAPFMTLSFMALLVIPRLKLGDRGLFDADTFRFLPLFEP